MKKLFLLLALMGMVATGCSKDDTDKGNDNKTEQPNENEGVNENDDDEKPVFEIDAEGSYTIPAEGAEIEVTITTNLEYRVEVSEDAKAWLSIGDTRAVRTETLIFTVTKNESDRERTATITIFNKDDEKVFEFRLTQKFNDKEDIPENIFFGLDKECVTISPDGGSVDVIVYSNYKWEISGVSDWCTPSLKNGGANEDGQKVTFSADMTYDDRDATFWFRCADKQIKFVVSQMFKETIIPDANNTFNIPAEGGIAVISYQTTVDCEVIIPEEAQDWITIAPATRGLVSENINLDIAENTTYSARTAVVKVVAKDNAELAVEYTINQEQKNGVLVDGNNTFNVSGAGGSVVIKYQANVDCEVIIPDDAQDWITIAPATRGLVSENINLDIAENTTYDSRSAVIKVVAKDNAELVVEYTINQEQNDAILADENNTFTLPSEGGNIVIDYQTNVDCEIIVPTNAQSWITILPETRCLVAQSATLHIAENTTYDSRSAVIKVVAKDNAELVVEYTITQEQKDAIIADDNNVFTVPGPGGEVVIKYQTNVDCEIIIPEEAQDWITIVPATRGLVTYNTTLNIAANYYGELRSSVIKVVSQEDNELFAEYTITQNMMYYLCYTSSNGKVVEPYSSTAFGVTIQSNTYKDGVGIIEFNAPITKIGDYAFSDCSNLTSVTIPDSITSIGTFAFKNCSSLTSIIIPDSVTEIGEQAFLSCSSLTSITIPNSITSIGIYTFKYCNSLTSVTIPDSITSIGDYAFACCSSLKAFYGKFASADNRCLIIDGVLNSFAPAGLTEYVIPDSVTSIGEQAFLECSNLKSVTIPNSVTSIREYAFRNCSSLTSVTIPDSVTSIGKDAFYYCSSLTSVTIPNSVTSIGSNAFSGCTGELVVNCNIPSASSSSSGAFYGSEFTSITIGDGVTKIGMDAFYYCSSLTSVTIPDSVTTIGGRAFSGCSRLTSVYITDLSAWCRINFGSHGANPLQNRANLYLNNELVTDLVIPSDITEIKSYLFSDCRSLTSVTIPDSVTTIGDYAFDYCSSLTSVTIPDSVTTIGNCAFRGCSSLTSVTIPDSVTTIRGKAFEGCSSLTSVTIPDSVTKIGDYAFRDCSSLTSVTIPDSITTIGNNAFYGCYRLTSVYCKATTPPAVTLGYYGWCAFDENSSGRKIYVPTESVEAYKSASGWSKYADAIEGYNF